MDYNIKNRILPISIIIVLFFSFGNIFSQKVVYPTILLSKVKNKIFVKDIPSSIDTVNLIVKSIDFKQTFYAKVQDNKAEIVVELNSSGKYTFMLYEKSIGGVEKIVLPGWLSIVPPLLAILLALIFRQVFVALFFGIYIGLLFIYEFNPLIALLRLIDTNIFNALKDPDHVFIILFTLLIGGVVGVISKNGGTIGLADKITKYAKTSRSGMLSSWFLGLVIFFDDYANSLIIGNMMRPITDKLKISREKLAYIVDSTAAPVASLVIISTWIGYELGLIGDSLASIGSDLNPYEVFIRTLPYRFYPIASMYFVFLTSLLQRDFGPMYKVEKNARKGNGYANEENKKIDFDTQKFSSGKAKWYNGAIPILIILFGTISGLIFTGIKSLENNNITTYGIDDIIKASDSYRSLLWASLVAGIVAIILTVSQKIQKLEDSLKAWNKGIQSMMIAAVILVMAWGISSITNELKTADYIISLLSDSISPRLLPAIIFIVCGIISFATGTSWGTMAIVMPIVIPLASTISRMEGLAEADTNLILIGVVSSVLAGSVWGDHCSPIADTTILSSIASKCNHIMHVKTQLPYSLLVGSVSLIFGDILTAYGFSPYLAILLIFLSLFLILKFFGKKV
ncbi:MAG: sodium:proton antiporter [Ignavibacteriae bacterium]|nr:MAG: sodium:proton antiporter [Ignavibacteriota bacterium]